MWLRILVSGWTYAVLFALFYGYALYSKNTMLRKQAEAHALATEVWADAVQSARDKEKALAASNQNTLDQFIRDTKETLDEKERTIADLRAGNRRLRERFQCPPNGVSRNSQAPSSSDGATQSGLLDADAEFLVRFAAEADERVNQLTACQAVLKDVTQ